MPGSPNSISVGSHRLLSSHWVIMNFRVSCPGPCLSLSVWDGGYFIYCIAWKELRRASWAAASNRRQSLGPLTWQSVTTHLPREVVTTCRGGDGARGLRASKKGETFQNGSLSNQGLTDQQVNLNLCDRCSPYISDNLSRDWLYAIWEPPWAGGWGHVSGEDQCLYPVVLQPLSGSHTGAQTLPPAQRACRKNPFYFFAICQNEILIKVKKTCKPKYYHSREMVVSRIQLADVLATCMSDWLGWTKVDISKAWVLIWKL